MGTENTETVTVTETAETVTEPKSEGTTWEGLAAKVKDQVARTEIAFQAIEARGEEILKSVGGISDRLGEMRADYRHGLDRVNDRVDNIYESVDHVNSRLDKHEAQFVKSKPLYRDPRFIVPTALSLFGLGMAWKARNSASKLAEAAAAPEPIVEDVPSYDEG